MASSVRARGNICLRKRLASKPKWRMRTKPLGEHMEEEAAQKLACVKCHDALFSAVGIVLVAEGDLFTVEAEQAVVGDSDAVGIAAQIAQYMRRFSEGRLGVDNPLLMAQFFEQFGEMCLIS